VLNTTLSNISVVGRGKGPSWSCSYNSWIYNYLCNQRLSLSTLWVRTPLNRGVLDTTLCDNVCHWLAADRLFSPGTPVSSTNKTDRHDINEILLKVTLNTITTNPIYFKVVFTQQKYCVYFKHAMFQQIWYWLSVSKLCYIVNHTCYITAMET
jgi:hypothetical protein